MNSYATPQNPTPPLQSGQPVSSQPPQGSYQPTQTAPLPQSNPSLPVPAAVPVSSEERHLIGHLVTAYRAHLDQLNQLRQQQGQATFDIDSILKLADPVLEYFIRYLSAYGPKAYSQNNGLLYLQLGDGSVVSVSKPPAGTNPAAPVPVQQAPTPPQQPQVQPQQPAYQPQVRPDGSIPVTDPYANEGQQPQPQMQDGDVPVFNPLNSQQKHPSHDMDSMPGI